MTTETPNERMSYTTAKELDLATASDADLVAAWHSYAGMASYLRADDCGSDWKLAPPIIARAREIETHIRARGGPRPTGTYLMTDDDRIDWETGEFSPGWHWKKQAASRALSPTKGETA
jgi:hypothetical protein